MRVFYNELAVFEVCSAVDQVLRLHAFKIHSKYSVHMMQHLALVAIDNFDVCAFNYCLIDQRFCLCLQIRSV